MIMVGSDKRDNRQNGRSHSSAPVDIEVVQKRIIDALKGLKGTDSVPGTYPEFFNNPLIQFKASAAYANAIDWAGGMLTRGADGKIIVDPMQVNRLHCNIDEFRRSLKQYLNRVREPLPGGPANTVPVAEWPADDVAKKILVELDEIKKTANAVPQFREEPKTLTLFLMDAYTDPKGKKRNLENEWRKSPETNTTIESPEQIPQKVARTLDRIWFMMENRGLDRKYSNSTNNYPLFQPLFGQERNDKGTIVVVERGAWHAAHDMVVTGENGVRVVAPDFKQKLAEFNKLMDAARDAAGLLPDKMGTDMEGRRRAAASLQELRQLQKDVNDAAKKFRISALIDPDQFPKFAMDTGNKAVGRLEDVTQGERNFTVASVAPDEILAAVLGGKPNGGNRPIRNA